MNTPTIGMHQFMGEVFTQDWDCVDVVEIPRTQRSYTAPVQAVVVVEEEVCWCVECNNVRIAEEIAQWYPLGDERRYINA